MFSKISRYRKLPDVVTTDAKGRSLESKSLRLLPDVSGTFLHTVEEMDRLDHLAYKYYKQPRKWWRICDANPEFMSPRALRGKEPVVTYRFGLTWEDEAGPPPWANLRSQLIEKVGVLDVKIVEDVQLVQDVKTIDDKQVTMYVENYRRSVIVTYNQMNVNSEDLADIMDDVGFQMAQPVKIGRLGKNIIIPRNIVG
jgi:hypothetical protein